MTTHIKRDSTSGARKVTLTARVAHVYLDVRRRALHCLNEAARELAAEGVPFTSSDLAKRPLRTLTGETVTSGDLPLLRAWRERTAREAVFILTESDGRVSHLSWHAAPLSDAHGEVIGVLGTMRLAPPDPDWAQLAGLAHDLRTPLQALQLLTPVLARNTPPESAEVLERMGAAAERTLAISKELLDWCRDPMQAGRTVARSWFALTAFAAALTAEQLPRAQKKNIVLRTNLMACQGWEVFCCSTRLGRLLANLLTNAVHYTQAGGVELKAGWREGRPGERQALTLTVIDTGPGISEEEQESIFHPFRRGKGGKESDSGGSGVGLSVVDRLVEELELTLEVFSEYGHGSSFELLIPMRFLRQSGALAKGGEPPDEHETVH